MMLSTLAQLDTLIGEHVMGASPRVFWEDSCSQFRFETLPEALEAMRDPFFSAFAPEEVRQRSSLREVKEYPAYSTDLETAMEVVEHLSSADSPFSLWRSFPNWHASFAGDDGVEGESAPIAICLAALRTCGIEALLDDAPASRPVQEAAI